MAITREFYLEFLPQAGLTTCQDYVWNKINLHIFAALFSGFTFWNIGNSSFDLQLRVFAIFNFIFVAPGCINQMQPFFLHNRDLFETREKKVSYSGMQLSG